MQHRPTLQQRCLAAAAVAVCAGAVVLAACAAGPSAARRDAASAPASAPLPPAAAARARATVVGARGPVGEAQKARDLARVAAEGRAADLERHLRVLAAQGDLNLYRGNSVKLLVDGPDTFAAMKAAIAQARQRVLLEFYIVEDEGVAAEVGELLLKKAAEGVHVALMYDSVGSFGSSQSFFDRLRAGGVAVCEFNPVNPLQRLGHWSLSERNHRKLLTVDAEVAYTGGINLSNVYAEGSLSSSRPRRRGAPPPQGWRDTQVELRGPVVTAMNTLFRESWTTQGCPGTLPAPPPPTQPAPGPRVVKLVAGNPDHGVNPTYTALLAATEAARHSVHLTMAYFAPGPELVRALAAAARRGVEVALVLPGRSDVRLVLHAARSYYAELLEAGVRIHEMPHAVLHAKTAVIDGVFATVGSSNLDWRSIAGNREIDVIVLGDDFGQALEALFSRDLALAERIDPARWRERGLGRRMLEGFGRLLEPLL